MLPTTAAEAQEKLRNIADVFLQDMADAAGHDGTGVDATTQGWLIELGVLEQLDETGRVNPDVRKNTRLKRTKLGDELAEAAAHRRTAKPKGG